MSSEALDPPRHAQNRRIALALFALVAGMAGLAYASVPLYALFCQVTGYGGTTQVAEGNPEGIISREISVRFDSNVEAGLGWTVTPARPITGQIGAVETVTYTAVNRSDEKLTGTAVFNVTPERAGMYFNKIECFCFTEQTLAPGERVEMPVTFFVDPELARNGELDTVREITLSYTFYAADTQGR